MADMSKQSKAKEEQGYVAKAVPMTCGNCAHFESDFKNSTGYFGGGYQTEINLRCGIGGFAVKKMGTCSRFEQKEEGGK